MRAKWRCFALTGASVRWSPGTGKLAGPGLEASGANEQQVHFAVGEPRVIIARSNGPWPMQQTSRLLCFYCTRPPFTHAAFDFDHSLPAAPSSPASPAPPAPPAPPASPASPASPRVLLQLWLVKPHAQRRPAAPLASGTNSRRGHREPAGRVSQHPPNRICPLRYICRAQLRSQWQMCCHLPCKPRHDRCQKHGRDLRGPAVRLHRLSLRLYRVLLQRDVTLVETSISA